MSGPADRRARPTGGTRITSITVDHAATAAEFEKRAADRMMEATSGRTSAAAAQREEAGVYAALATSHRIAQLVDVLAPDVVTGRSTRS